MLINYYGESKLSLLDRGRTTKWALFEHDWGVVEIFACTLCVILVASGSVEEKS
jgi:hypothetical protein